MFLQCHLLYSFLTRSLKASLKTHTLGVSLRLSSHIHTHINTHTAISPLSLPLSSRPYAPSRPSTADCVHGMNEWTNFLNYSIGTIALFSRIPLAPGKLWNLIPERPLRNDGGNDVTVAWRSQFMYTRADQHDWWEISLSWILLALCARDVDRTGSLIRVHLR